MAAVSELSDTPNQWEFSCFSFASLFYGFSVNWVLFDSTGDIRNISANVFFFSLICSDLEVDLESEENASIVYAALVVDKELQPDKVKRQMSISDGKLSVHFEAVEARFLRASFSAFVDVLILATKTIEELGPGMEL
ncbi:CTAG/Pcc1 family - like 1 [Theobroma cacao]|nr:CTAG/Pcc1 family - like 1 [Theobroma cacao]